MSEDLNQAVPATSATEAVPPVRAIDSDDPALLRNKIELAKADTSKAVAKNQAYRQQVEDMQKEIAAYMQQDQSKQQEALLANGQAEKVVEQLRGTVSKDKARILELEQLLQDKDSAFQQSQIKSAAINAFYQGGAHTPEDLFNLEKDKFSLKDGQVVALVGGVEIPLQQHLESLKSPGSGKDYFFAGSGARGMGSIGSTPTSTGGSNPYVTRNFTEALRLESENPELAARLKSQASS